MKVLNKYNLVLMVLLGAIPYLASAKKTMHEETRAIEKSFEVNSESEVFFYHRRGPLTVKYIDGNEGRIDAQITVKGEDAADVQTLLNAIEIGMDRIGNRTEINTADNVKSWSNSNGIFWSKHKLVLKNGIEISTKVEQVSIVGTLYLPKVKSLSLTAKYDDILIDRCEAEKLNVDIHSGKLKTGIMGADTYVKIRYGKLDMQQLGNLKLESHDSKGTIGNILNLDISDKYSEFTIGNLNSLNATLQDGDYNIGNVVGDVNISDKYSEIQIGNVGSGEWSFHDSDIVALNAGDLRIRTKYTKFNMKAINSIKLNAHDDNFIIQSVGDLKIVESKYTEYVIRKILRKYDVDYSHDDDYEIEEAGAALELVDFNGKYTNLRMALPEGKGYALKGKLRYGDLKYSKEGLKESRYVKDGDNFEIETIAADGSNSLSVNIEAHDCRINLEN